MDHTTYVTLTRQTGLLREMQVVANNIANATTTGFRQEGITFSEYVQRLNGLDSVSMAYGNSGKVSYLQGALSSTGGDLDFAIEGDGFFLLQTPEGQRLTRAGHFSLSAQSDLVSTAGHPVLDAGGAPIFVPPGTADVRVAADGTVTADDQLIGQIGVVLPGDASLMRREAGVLFDPGGDVVPAETARVMQGFVEKSNVDPITQLARMIEVQRAYEMGQSFLDSENQRVRDTIKSLTR